MYFKSKANALLPVKDTKLYLLGLGRDCAQYGKKLFCYKGPRSCASLTQTMWDRGKLLARNNIQNWGTSNQQLCFAVPVENWLQQVALASCFSRQTLQSPERLFTRLLAPRDRSHRPHFPSISMNTAIPACGLLWNKLLCEHSTSKFVSMESVSQTYRCCADS